MSAGHCTLKQDGVSDGTRQRDGFGAVEVHAVVPPSLVLRFGMIRDQSLFRAFHGRFYDVEAVGIMGQENALAVDSGYGRVVSPRQGAAVGTVGQRPNSSNQSDQADGRKLAAGDRGNHERSGPAMVQQNSTLMTIPVC